MLGLVNWSSLVFTLVCLVLAGRTYVVWWLSVDLLKGSWDIAKKTSWSKYSTCRRCVSYRRFVSSLTINDFSSREESTSVREVDIYEILLYVIPFACLLLRQILAIYGGHQDPQYVIVLYWTYLFSTAELVMPVWPTLTIIGNINVLCFCWLFVVRGLAIVLASEITDTLVCLWSRYHFLYCHPFWFAEHT